MQRTQFVSLLQNLETCACISEFTLEVHAVDYGIMQCIYIVAEASVFGILRLDFYTQHDDNKYDRGQAGLLAWRFSKREPVAE